jgi:hypothetical protein
MSDNIHKIADAYLKNWLAVRNDGAPPVVTDNRPDTNPDLPQRHDIDAVASAYVAEQTEIFTAPKMAVADPLCVTIVREESKGPRYLAGFLKNRIVWTHEFSRAMRVPYDQHARCQQVLGENEHETFAVWA